MTRDPINPDCPRIAHETGVVLGCQVDHVDPRPTLHGTVSGVMWTDNDDRIAADWAQERAPEEPHHRQARLRTDDEERALTGHGLDDAATLTRRMATLPRPVAS